MENMDEGKFRVAGTQRLPLNREGKSTSGGRYADDGSERRQMKKTIRKTRLQEYE